MDNVDIGVASASCEDTCAGTQVDIATVRGKLIDDTTAVELSDLFKALGDPTRIRIIHALLQSELCVHDLTEVLVMGQSAISHQLRLLRNMRIVKRRKVGKTVFYSLDDDHVEQLIVLTLQHLKHG
ncbi:metalloregulator ArsR/SmtB family transcription factor [Paenibacillus sp. L3-i20]|uniref:ArsR/SmtB family transcription factor n=1 Tax=Paenibacillus sp. L3-i20 TaxID=2905833 RepID=UPI001EDFD160|nr:metalloregulator ArsR/SmtB family transcription factor [Paenibacillus sp. L3-i20]GKU80436.1 transcriptional regulator [Paenibacillus sp. L3-i20]